MAGELTLDGRSLPLRERRQRIAYMPQDTGATSPLTVLEVVLSARMRNLGMRLPPALIDEATGALQAFGLLSMQNCTLTETSGGQRQLIYLAQALFRKPQVLLLDEPTAALDLRHQLLVRAYGAGRAALKRNAEVADITGAALYLASLLSRFTTGQTPVVDGGKQFI